MLSTSNSHNVISQLYLNKLVCVGGWSKKHDILFIGDWAFATLRWMALQESSPLLTLVICCKYNLFNQVFGKNKYKSLLTFNSIEIRNVLSLSVSPLCMYIYKVSQKMCISLTADSSVLRMKCTLINTAFIIIQSMCVHFLVYPTWSPPRTVATSGSVSVAMPGEGLLYPTGQSPKLISWSRMLAGP